MATAGNGESMISPKEPSHADRNPHTGSAVAAPEHSNGTPVQHGRPTSAAHEELQSQDKAVHDPNGLMSQHAWPQNVQNIGMHSATPLNNFATKVGSESFMPTTMDKECEKAARILRGFCKDGVYHDPEHHPSADPAQLHEPSATSTPHAFAQTHLKSKHHVLLTIPSKVVSEAVGLAIFTTARAGFHISGAAGSGIIVARLPDGTWSPPSGIQVHTLGAGFLIGADIYDCVCVINTRPALETFMKTRFSLGPELSVAVGPFGVGGRMDFAAPTGRPGAHVQLADAKKIPINDASTSESTENVPSDRKSNKGKLGPLHEALNKPVYSYVNSRGFYAGIQVDGTVITERKDANGAFYGEMIPVEKILRGEVPAQGPSGMWPVSARMLSEVLKGAETWRGNKVAGVESGVQHRDNGPLPAADGPLPAAAHEE